MTPQEASLKKNEATVYKKLYPPEKKVKVQKPKFKVGDHVRITIKRGDFRKGYRPNFTRELFIITEMLNAKPFTYRIKDFEGEVIEGSFYEQEMVKVKTHK